VPTGTGSLFMAAFLYPPLNNIITPYFPVTPVCGTDISEHLRNFTGTLKQQEYTSYE